MDDPDTPFPGEVVDDEYVDLRADLIADVEDGAVHVLASPDDRGPRISDAVLRDATFRNVVFERTRFNGVYVDGLEWWTWGPDLTPWLDGFTINGVEIAPLVEAELDRRHPERVHLRDIETLEHVRSAWPHVEDMWAPTIDRARALPEAVLHERVDDEFSFLETLRHLLFATDAWIRRAVLGEDRPFHAIAFPGDTGAWSTEGTVPWSEVGIDVHADPSLDEVMAARDENFALIRRTLADLDEETFRSTPAPQQSPGYPSGTEVRPVFRCLRTIVNEEWWHHQFATRDLAVLTAPAGDAEPT